MHIPIFTIQCKRRSLSRNSCDLGGIKFLIRVEQLVNNFDNQMATFIQLHIKSCDRLQVAQRLKALANIAEISEERYPTDFTDRILQNSKGDADPTFILIGTVKDGWIRIQLNSFKKMHTWAEKISREIQTTVVQIMGQTASDVYYFLMYEQGNLRREIEVYHGDAENAIDIGAKFAFEKQFIIPTSEEDFVNLFDRDTLEAYCNELGFDPFTDAGPEKYYILKKQQKPWWRPW